MKNPDDARVARARPFASGFFATPRMTHIVFEHGIRESAFVHPLRPLCGKTEGVKFVVRDSGSNFAVTRTPVHKIAND